MEANSKRHLSAGEREAVVILVSILVIASAVLGLLFYESTYPLCSGPCPSRESLNLMFSTVNSPTSVTLKMINAGPRAISLASYYVKDSNGQTYASNNWSGPNIAPNTTVSVNVLIDGKAFTFQTGSTYTVLMVTSRNNQYGFTVMA
jgi:hypothetical protein